MVDFSDFTDEFDLAISLNLPNIAEADDDRVFEVIEVLFLITRHYYTVGTSKCNPFSFTANQTLSGWGNPCGDLGCRLLQVDRMLSFVSLYADDVYVRNPFEQLYMDIKRRGLTPKIRQELDISISIYFMLRPYLKSGIVKYANSNYNFCSDHIEEIVKPFKSKLRENEDKLFNALLKYYSNKVSASYDESDDRSGFLAVVAPESLIEHKKQYFHLFDNSGSYIEERRKLGLPYKLSNREIREDGVMDLLINPLIEDLSFYGWHSKFHNTNLLTNDDLQFKIMNKLNVNGVNTDVITNQFKQTLTVAENTTPETIIELRKANEEHFSVYRERTKQFLSTVKGLNTKEQEEAYSDLVRCEIANINKQLKVHKTKFLSKKRQELVFGTGVLAVGAYFGIIPNELASLLAAAGGATAAASLLVEVNQQFQPDHIAQDNDFYFLWKTLEK
ncbi:hypothetical protein [Vibrio parahaemolyticus]|uniref:hypothetical protein n=1 Tax=Vibrio parahaemolyticus TaxID=670 RepID=UPI00111E3BBD|nr:hypothetical protein [Vibrio parahaemolyticus]TOM96352.1 hypothetical protein CGH65_21800 [Vibrio parahaemolyticus]